MSCCHTQEPTTPSSTDSDGDGVSDFLEDAFGTDKDTPDAVLSKPVYSRDAAGNIDYTVMNATSGYTYKLQRSKDLVTWTTEATLVQGDPSVVTISNTHLETDGKVFIRIQVTK